MYVFWDWNGTLCDDVLLALEAVNDMLRKRKYPTIDLETYYRYIDSPISKFYAHLFDLNEVPMREISPEYQSYYHAHLRESCLMPGALEVLQTLQQAGVHQILLSSGHTESVYPVIERLGLLPFFDALLLSDRWDAPPKTDRALQYCKQHRIDGRDAWFIGDLLHDKETADACGASCLLIPAGHQSEEALRLAGTCYCASIRDVPARLGLQKT